MEYALPIVALVTLVILAIRQVTVLEYEKGLRYVKGKFEVVLGPGQYWSVRIFGQDPEAGHLAAFCLEQRAGSSQL